MAKGSKIWLPRSGFVHSQCITTRRYSEICRTQVFKTTNSLMIGLWKSIHPSFTFYKDYSCRISLLFHFKLFICYPYCCLTDTTLWHKLLSKQTMKLSQKLKNSSRSSLRPVGPTPRRGRREDLMNPDRRSGIHLMKKPLRLFQVIRGIYVNILRITVQAGRRDQAIWHFWDGF